VGLGTVRATTAAAALAVAVAASASAQAAAAAAKPVQSHLVTVTLREYAIAMSAELRPGRTTFLLHNRGRFPHNFTAIYGPTRFHSRDVPPGGTVRFTTVLVPGAYMVACTVLAGGHLAQGMFALFTIGTRAHGSAAWHYP
jgi:plastocyanin